MTGCIPGQVETTTGTVQVKGAASPIVIGKDTVWAAYLPSYRTIIVDQSLPLVTKMHYIRHERCHAILSDEEVVLDSLTEEKVCEAIAKGFKGR